MSAGNEREFIDYLQSKEGGEMKVLPIEPKDEKKPCFTKSYTCWFSEAGMFKRIIKDAKQSNLKIVDFEDKLFSCVVTFQEE